MASNFYDKNHPKIRMHQSHNTDKMERFSVNRYDIPQKLQIFVFDDPEMHTCTYKLSEIYCKTKLVMSYPFLK